jgi:hypothetical protein
MNNRKWPRTLNEAFPNTVEYSCSIERPRPKGWMSLSRLVVWFLVGSFITMLIRNLFNPLA